jgi:hypothetical protein
MTGVDVAAGGVAPEDPVAVGVSRGQVIAGLRRQFAPRSIKWVWQRDLNRAATDRDEVVGDFHIVPGESDNILDLLPEDENEGRRSAVACGEFV